MYYSYYLRFKPVGYFNYKSYQIVVTFRTFNKNIPYRFIEKVGLVINLKRFALRADRIVLLNTSKLKNWFIKNIRITKPFFYHFFFCNYEYDQGCKSFLNLYNTYFINKVFIKKYSLITSLNYNLITVC